LKRPQIISFLAVKTPNFINIKIYISLVNKKQEIAFPLQNAHLLSTSCEFRIKIIGLNSLREKVYENTFLSDSFGKLNIKIFLNETTENISALQIYEMDYQPGIELILGTFLPKDISLTGKIVISDFDKTLIETKSRTLTDIYNSLTLSLDSYPLVDNGISLLKDYINKGFHPFLVSASPHFFEDSIRNWLYQNQIYSAGIFLKDYRHFFNMIKGHLAPKDISTQGVYKLDHLFDITLMTDLPQEIILIGDNAESDPFIYLLYKKIINKEIDPWSVWNKFKNHNIFKMTSRQHSYFLSKIYQIQDLISNHHNPVEIKIHIREIHDRNLQLSIYQSLDLDHNQIFFFSS